MPNGFVIIMILPLRNKHCIMKLSLRNNNSKMTELLRHETIRVVTLPLRNVKNIMPLSLRNNNSKMMLLLCNETILKL